MINILCVKTGKIRTNTYIVYLEENAVIIDPGDEPEKIEALLKKHNLTCKYVLLTHGHFDHINAVTVLKNAGAKVAVHESDVPLVDGTEINGAQYGIILNPFTPDIVLKGGETLELCGITFKVLHTPGHTKGCVCFIAEDNIFSGDTLFYRDVGNTGRYPDSENILVSSIKNTLFALKGDYKVYPGHGISTTLNDERNLNPYVRISN